MAAKLRGNGEYTLNAQLVIEKLLSIC